MLWEYYDITISQKWLVKQIYINDKISIIWSVAGEFNFVLVKKA